VLLREGNDATEYTLERTYRAPGVTPARVELAGGYHPLTALGRIGLADPVRPRPNHIPTTSPETASNATSHADRQLRQLALLVDGPS